MRPYFPIQLELPHKINLFTLRYKQLYSEVIEKHTKAIQEKLTPVSSPLLERLNNTEFWDILYSISDYNKEIPSLRSIWEKVEPLAHLDSKQLLALYEEEVLPLERGYEYFSSNQPHSVTEQLQSNMKRIETLKTLIFDGLLYRAMAFKMLNQPRNADDIVAGIAYEINQLNLLEEPLQHHGPYSQTLNDDRRLTIHDLLKIAGLDEETLQEVVLKDMPMHHFPERVSQSQIIKRIDEMNAFSQNILNNLGLGRFSEKLFSQRIKDYFTYLLKLPYPSLIRDGINFIQDKINWVKIKNKIQLLFNLQYVVYFAVSFFAYYALIEFLTPILFLVVSTNIFNTISSLLFYTVAMAPAWAFGWKFIKNFKDGAHDYLTCWKKQEVLDALVALERVEFCFANKLSQVVVDIAHFDIDQLMISIQNCEDQLRTARQGLERFAPGEKKLCQGKLVEQLETVTQRIDTVKKELKERLSSFAKQIATIAGSELEWIDTSLSTDKLIPLFPIQQLEKLKKFVFRYGAQEDKEKFIQETDILRMWINKIVDNKFSFETQGRLPLEQPWGKLHVNKALLRKWESLLTSFARNDQEREAAVELNNLFMGKVQMTKEHLCQVVSRLSRGKDVRVLMEKVQTFLFDNQDPRYPQNASLFSMAQRDEVKKWYKIQKESISKATKEIEGILEKHEIADEKLAEYFELLDGADVYCYSLGKNADFAQRQNLARRLFEAYTGDKSFAYRIVRFIPKNEQADAIEEIAKKRLIWMISQLDKSVNPSTLFEKADVEMFQEMVLMGPTFDFNTIISSAISGQKLSKSTILPFLRACLERGINTTKLVQFYQQAQRNGYSPVLQRLGDPKSCAIQVLPSIHNTEQERVRVAH